MAKAQLKRETAPDTFIPYVRHVTPEIIGLNTGALVSFLDVGGMSFETADTRDINRHHDELNTLYRNVADERLALWSILIRRRSNEYPGGAFSSAFSTDLDAKYRDELTAEDLYSNRLVVAIVHVPTGLKAKMAGAESDPDAIKRLTDAVALFREGLSRSSSV